MQTQNELVATHLVKHGSISPMEAFTVYGITRLAARIHEIKQARNWAIDTDMRADESGTRYARYRLRTTRVPVKRT